MCDFKYLLAEYYRDFCEYLNCDELDEFGESRIFQEFAYDNGFTLSTAERILAAGKKLHDSGYY